MIEALEHPRLAELFRALRDGRHLCLEDGPLYTALEQHSHAFRDLFRALGYRLEHHRKGVYYFRGDSAVTDTARRFCVFTWILVEHLGDRGDGIEEALFAGTFSIDELPHLQTERYQQTMAELGVADGEGIVRVLAGMERFGFATVQGDRVRFRRPLYRIVDLCIQLLGEGADDAAESGQGDVGERTEP